MLPWILPGRLKSIPLPSLAPSKDPGDSPLFQSSISRWLWRIYTQRLTPAGRWFALATAGFVSYGGASFQLQGYVLASYAQAIWVIAIIALLIYRPRTRLKAELPTRVCAGETVQVDVQVQQLSRLRGADLVVLAHRLPPQIDAVPQDGVPLPDLRQGQLASVRLGLKCNRRGVYTLRGFRVETGFPFGILRGRQTFAHERRLLVYPTFRPLNLLRLPTGRRYQPGGVALASELGESFDYLGNREYREGDNVRDIDWRATARARQLIVREWVEEYMLRVAVILDTHVPGDAAPQRRDDFERAVSIAAAVCDYMARQDYLVDLFAAGPNLYHLTAGRSLAYLDQILDILACVDENPHEPFEIIEPQIAELLSRISTVICVMLDWTQSRRMFVHRLREQGVAVKIIILRDGACAVDPAADADVLGQVPVIGKADFDRGIAEL
ncbi:DUF58 domain-containing protein [Fontivita pretiosa]|uniref:DUF58 domain-containing protein n=1 Tax=Fontivita pretiosa TaxID=2989684 RepID=UPI003D17D522